MPTILKFQRPKQPIAARKKRLKRLAIVAAIFLAIVVLSALYPSFIAYLDANSDKSGMLTGAIRISDGDTIWLGDVKVRLHGIDAPESRQNCYDASETLYPCGSKSTAHLRELIGSTPVYCDGRQKDRYGRLIAVCYTDELNLNAEMVRSGWAVAYKYYSKDYVIHELMAKVQGLGLWQGHFEEPYAWRTSKPKKQ